MQKTRFLESTNHVALLEEPSSKDCLSDDFSDMTPTGPGTHAFIFVAGFSTLVIGIILFFNIISFCSANSAQDLASTGRLFLTSAHASSQSSPLGTASTQPMAALHWPDTLWKEKGQLVSEKVALPLIVAIGLWLKLWQFRHLARASSQVAHTTRHSSLSGRPSTPTQA